MSPSQQQIEKKKSQAVWGATPAGSSYAMEFEPGTKDFFLQSYRIRSTQELPFLKEIVPFESFRGKKVLEVGCGVGYDAYEFCSYGAVYTGIDITLENPGRCRSHLRLFGFEPSVMVADGEFLPCKDTTTDVIYSNGVLHHTPDIMRSFSEVHRVLRPEGEFWVILYHRNSVFHWLTVIMFDYILTLGFLRHTYRERLSMIEYTTSNVRPLVNVYSKSEVRLLLESAGFRTDQLWVRRLTKDDFPNAPVLKILWAWIPKQWMDWLGTKWGWYVIAKATKRP